MLSKKGPEPSPVTRICCFGASLTEGYCNHGSECYPYGFVLQELLGKDKFEVTVSGNSGETTAELLRRLPSVLSCGPFDIVVVLGGSNDIGCDVPLADTERNLRGITKVIQHHGAVAVLLSIPPCGRELFEHEGTYLLPRQKALNDRIKQICIDESATFVDLFSKVADKNGRLLDEVSDVDGLHFSKQGYQQLARIVQEAVLRMNI